MALQLWPFAEIHNNFHKIHLLCFPHVMLHVLHRKFIFQDEIQKFLSFLEGVPTHLSCTPHIHTNPFTV